MYPGLIDVPIYLRCCISFLIYSNSYVGLDDSKNPNLNSVNWIGNLILYLVDALAFMVLPSIFFGSIDNADETFALIHVASQVCAPFCWIAGVSNF